MSVKNLWSACQPLSQQGIYTAFLLLLPASLFFSSIFQIQVEPFFSPFLTLFGIFCYLSLSAGPLHLCNTEKLNKIDKFSITHRTHVVSPPGVFPDGHLDYRWRLVRSGIYSLIFIFSNCLIWSHRAPGRSLDLQDRSSS